MKPRGGIPYAAYVRVNVCSCRKKSRKGRRKIERKQGMRLSTKYSILEILELKHEYSINYNELCSNSKSNEAMVFKKHCSYFISKKFVSRQNKIYRNFLSFPSSFGLVLEKNHFIVSSR